MSKITDSISKTSNEFSFISTFFDLVGNKEFKKAELSTMYTSTETAQTSLWRSLSAVAEKLGKEFYDSTLNFIDNIANIDLCKVSQLQSLIKMLGIDYSVLANIDDMPVDIVKLLDLLSVKKEYLASYVKMDSKFVNDILSGGKFDDVGYVAGCTLPSAWLQPAEASRNAINAARNEWLVLDPQMSSYWSTADAISCEVPLDDTAVDNYISAAFYSLLSSKVQQNYNDKAETLIYKHLSDCILLSDFELPNDSASKIESYRKLFNISKSFDVEAEVDNYENGLVELSDYTTQELSLLNIEIERRKEPYAQAQLKTRYKYYREKEVQEYSTFIENESKDDQQLCSFSGSQLYDIDSSYFEISEDDNASSMSSLYSMKALREDTGAEEITCNLDVVAAAAQKLATIATSIRQIREQLKYQCQKNYMYGTENLARHIIQEYIKNNTSVVLKRIGQLDSGYVFDTDSNTVSFTEYQDTTDYFNVSCAADELLKQTAPSDEVGSIREPYWKNSSSSNTIGAFDTTDLFAQLPLLASTSEALSEEQLSGLYVQTLGAKLRNPSTQESDSKQLPGFLTSLYSIGADSTFVSDDIFHTYDSYELKEQLDSISTMHAQQIADIASSHKMLFEALSGSALSSQAAQLIANSTSGLRSQLAELRNLFVDDSNLQLVGYADSLLNALSAADELSDEVKLADAVAEISSKYYDIDLSWQEMHGRALETDSYEMQRQYDTFVEKCSNDWCAVSASYAQASSYIPDSFETQDLSLCQQLSALHASLSSLPSVEREAAESIVTKLSSSIAEAGELSSVVGLDVLLETLSTQYENKAAEKQSELCLLRSSDLFKYREQVHQQYTGRSTGDTPWYYLKNTWHPSYMLHPCLYNFVEKTQYDYPVDNIVNVDVSSAAAELSSSIDDYVDDDGYLINMQRNPLNTNQDYLSRYEQQNKNGIDSVQADTAAYDGLFYPPALHDFLDNKTYTGDLAKLSSDIVDSLKTVQGMSSEVIQACIDYYLDKTSKYTAVSFIDALSGLTAFLSDAWHNKVSSYVEQAACELLSDSICKLTVSYDVTNPWYAALDLGAGDKVHIAEQLSALRDELAEIAKKSSYDIFRYGLDAYKNAYCLLKDYTSVEEYANVPPCCVDYDIRQQQSGKLWMRVKDHPIAFPLYLMDGQTSALANTAQLTSDSNCNQQYVKFRTRKLVNDMNCQHYAPDIQDFMFNESRDKLIINGIVDNDKISASYPVIVQVSQSYDDRDSITYYKHQKVDTDNPVLALLSERKVQSSLSSYQLASYFSFDTKLGVIYSCISSSRADDTADDMYVCSVMIAGAYYDYSSNGNKTATMSTLVDVLSSNSVLENVCIDTCGDTVTVAYLDEVPEVLSNYISKQVNVAELSASSGDVQDTVLDVVVKTKKYTIGRDSFLECSKYGDYLSNEHSYIPYTDMGFYGLLGNRCSNALPDSLGETYLAENDIEQRGIYKFQLLSEPVLSDDISKMIDFQFMLPVRRYDSSEDIDSCLELKTTPLNTTYKALSYLCAHYYEALADGTTSSLADYSSLSSDINVYDPASFMTMMQGYMPMVKIDESYLNDVDKSLLNEETFYSWPVLFYSTEDGSRDIPDKFQHPYSQAQADIACNCSFQLLPEVPPVSVSWCKYLPAGASEPAIKLDFNSLYYQSADKSLTANSFNLMHLFLNLDKPGDAGILNIYEDPLADKYTKYVSYYIKNVSDSKPKFLLSAHANVQVVYPMFITENSDTNTNKISVLAGEDKMTTAIAYEQAMLQLM